MLPVTYIEARDIPDAWFQCLSKILDVGFKYPIQHGSFVDETRLEFDYITIQINKAYSEPWDTMLPDIPVSLGIPNPVENGYVEQYVPYLMTSEKTEEEEYTYGERLTKFFVDYDKVNNPNYGDQIYHWINLLRKTPNTNQAVLQVAQPSDCLLEDPTCLRHIDMRVKKGKLVFYPYFRSWDLWGGFPANLAGIAVLQKYMADEIGIDTGPIIASSKGLHIYGYVEELAKLRCYKE